MLEAAITLPVFLAIVLISMNAMIFCFHLLQFQHEVSELTRQTFVLNANQRATARGQGGTLDWEPFLVDKINARAAELGFHRTDSQSGPASNATVKFDSGCSGWSCASSANVGSIFSIDMSLTAPIFSGALAGISWGNVPIRIKAVAFIQKPEKEGES